MLSGNTLIGLALVVVMSILLLVNRKKVQVQKILSYAVYFVMVRTKLGLKAMDRLQFVRKLWIWLGYAGVVLGFIGLAVISYTLIKGTVLLFLQPESAPTIMPVLPIEAKGVLTVPMAYWIISIFIIAVVHEFAHGLAARAYNIPVKSSGFAFLGVVVPLIPAAFVEPDEKKLQKAPARAQLSVFAAGPFANILLAVFIVFAFGFGIPGVSRDLTGSVAIWDIPSVERELFTVEGQKISSIKEGSPAEIAGVKPGYIITEVDGIKVGDIDAFNRRVLAFKPGDRVSLNVNGTIYPVTLIADETGERGIMGVDGLEPVTALNEDALSKYGEFGVDARVFFMKLVFWIFLLTIGIGLFNLLPLGPIDGGRMFLLFSQTISRKHGLKIWKYTSIFFLALIVINFVVPFLR